MRFSLLSLFLACFMGFGYYYVTKHHDDRLPIIAIAQMIDHPTLNTIRASMIEKLEKQGLQDGKNVRFIYQNAHGQMSITEQMAQHFAELNPKVIVAFAAKSAQFLQKVSHNKKIPLIFTAVTDPIAEKLTSSLSKPEIGLTGISDYMPPAPQLRMMKTLVPKLKILGILYHPSSLTSSKYLESFENAAINEGITLVHSPLTSINEVPTVIQKLMKKVDALYIPNDMHVIALTSTIAAIAHHHGVPVFAHHKTAVERGALAALVYDPTHMGYATADYVMAAWEKGYALQKPIQIGTTIQTIVNPIALKQLKLSLPNDLSSALMTPEAKE